MREKDPIVDSIYLLANGHTVVKDRDDRVESLEQAWLPLVLKPLMDAGVDVTKCVIEMPTGDLVRVMFEECVLAWKIYLSAGKKYKA